MTKKIRRSGIFLLLFAAAVSCKKSGSETTPGTSKAEPVEHGAPQGTPVTKTIGPAGGTIQTTDGNMSVEIPAGAVTTETTFSIQPVEHTLASATGTAYRLGPENVQFQKDLKISFKYTDKDLLGTTENDLYLAYQDAGGFWKRVVLTSIDKTNKTLTVNTRHFSDWAVERIFRIENIDGKERLTANEEVGLITYMDDVDENGNIISKAVVPDQNIDGWFVNGPGAVNHPKSTAVIYTAPASIVEFKTIAIGVRVKNLISKRHPERPGTEGLAIVQIPIDLVPDEYFLWEMDGTKHVSLAMDAALLGTTTNLIGTGLTGGVSVFLNAAKAGNYEAGNGPDLFNVQVSVPGSSTVVYLTAYYLCGEVGPRYGKGKITIAKFGSIGDVIYGNFTATVYARIDDCQHKSKQIFGSFRIRRKA